MQPSDIDALANSIPTEVDCPTWPDLPEEPAYHGLAGDFVRRIEPHTESDRVAILTQFLVMAGNIMGRSPHVRVEDDRHTANINVVIVGDTAAARKGTSLSRARHLFKLVEPEWSANEASGLSSGEGLIWTVRDPIEETTPIREKNRVTGYDTHIADHGVADKRLLVVESEFSTPLRVAEREGNTLTALLRKAWDDGNLRSLTKTSPARATDAHISIIGHITQPELLRYMSTTEMCNGFANRFMWVCAKRSKLLPEGGHLQPDALNGLVIALRDAIDFGKSCGEVKRDEQAAAQWRRVYEHLSTRKTGLLGAILSRAEAQVTRLSLIYALLDRSSCIRSEHLTAALALWEYVENSARHIFGNTIGDPVADTILSALRADTDGLTRTDINGLFSRNCDKERIEVALRVLRQQNLATSMSEKTPGRTAERWFAIRISMGGEA